MPYKLIIMPEGATLPEDLADMLVEPGDFIARVYHCLDAEKFVPVNTRELQMLVEYRDLLPLELKAIIGLPGAMYNTVWNTYVSTMTRITVDNIRSAKHEQNDVDAKEGQLVHSMPTRSDRLARFTDSVRSRHVAEKDEISADDPGISIDGEA